MNTLRELLDRTDRRRRRDVDRFHGLDQDECQLCGAYGADKRTLVLRYFYAIHEVVPEAVDLQEVEGQPDGFYFLRTCKACRGRFLDHMKVWRDECIAMRGLPKDHDGGVDLVDPDAMIPVRSNGRIVWMTEEQYAEYRAAREDG